MQAFDIKSKASALQKKRGNSRVFQKNNIKCLSLQNLLALSGCAKILNPLCAFYIVFQVGACSLRSNCSGAVCPPTPPDFRLAPGSERITMTLSSSQSCALLLASLAPPSVSGALRCRSFLAFALMSARLWVIHV